MKKYKKTIKDNLVVNRWQIKSRATTLLIIAMLMLPIIGSVTSVSGAVPSLALHVDGKSIKDASGNIFYLRGVNQPDFVNDADGAWFGNTLWTDNNVKAQLDIMKSWGINTIRCMFAVNQWKDNTIDSLSSIHNQDAIKRLISFAGERGMYVILTGYTLKSSITLGGNLVQPYQDPLPYPPYQTTPGGSTVIASQQDFINFWVSVASELKIYPNVLFELWNEPHASSSDLNTWLDVSQQCITAIRATGTQNIVLVSGNDWGSTWVNLDTTNREDMSWVFNHALIGGNVVFNSHWYSQGLQGSGSVEFQYSDVDRALQLMRYYDVAAQYPLIVSEICPKMDGVNVNGELSFFQNALGLFNSHGISYTAWGWWSATSFRLLSSEAPNYTPNAAGTILKNALSTNVQLPSATPTLTPTPTPTTTVTQSNTFKVGDTIQNIYATNDIGTITSIDSTRNWAEVNWNSGKQYGIAVNCIRLLSTSTQPSATPTTTVTQSNSFKVGDTIQNIYATNDIGTITSIDSTRNWAEVNWNSGKQYGIAVNCIRLLSTSTQPSATPTTTVTQSNTFKVGDTIQNIYATNDIGTITSIDSTRNWAEVNWNSGKQYGIAVNCIRHV